MDKYDIEITKPAENDLSEIRRYIAEELFEPQIAENTINRIAEAIWGLEEIPLRYALVTDERLALYGIRKLIVDNYIVFYIVTEGSRNVTIVRIFYGRRDWLNLL